MRVVRNRPVDGLSRADHACLSSGRGRAQSATGTPADGGISSVSCINCGNLRLIDARTFEKWRREREGAQQHPADKTGGAYCSRRPWPSSANGPCKRIARVETAIEGLRHSQNLTIGATAAIGGILAAMIVGFGIYGLQRIDQTQSLIAREAAATRQELVGVTPAIANSITAARQMPPIGVTPVPPHPGCLLLPYLLGAR